MDEVNIRFGASIEDLTSKLALIGELFKGIAEGAKAELSERAGAAFGAMGLKTSELGNILDTELRQRAAAVFGVFGRDAQKAAETVVKYWDDIPDVFKRVGLALLSLAAIVAAGYFAKKFADDNAEMVESTRDFARALGISTNEASVMKAALDDIGASTSEYEGAAKGLARQLRTNEEAMQKAGLVTRDEAGNLRPLNELMLDGIKLLGEYKEGTDRNIASQSIFGRGIDASSRLMLLNKQTVEENRRAVDELSLSVGESSVEAWKDYDAASDRAGLTMKAFGKAIAESVLPVATELTEWFNNLAPAAITVIRGALSGLTTAFLALTNGVRVVWEVINAFVISVAEPIRAVAEAVGKAITGDFAGAASAITGIGAVIGDAWGTAFDKIGASSEKTRNRIGQVWAFATGGNDATGDSGSPAGTRSAEVKTKKVKAGRDSGEDKVDAAELALEKADADAALAVLKEYLAEDKALNDEAYKHHLITIGEFFDRKLEIELQGNQQSLDSKQRELAAAEEAERKARERMAAAKTPKEANKAEADVLKAEAEEAKLLGAINVLEAQRGELIRKNGVDRADAEKKLGEQLTNIEIDRVKSDSLDGIAQERADLASLKQMRQISADDAFRIERDLETRSFAATRAAMEAKRAMLQDGDIAAITKANVDIEAAERQHQARMTQIDREANFERRRAGVEFASSVESNFASMIGSVLRGTATMGNAFKAFGATVSKMFTDLAAKKFVESIFDATGLKKAIERMTTMVVGFIGDMVKSWIGGETAKTAATTAGASTRTGVEATAAATSKSTTIGDAIMTIGAKAWQAAASVYASIAAIPYVGPFLAPAMAIAAGAAVLGFVGRIASSEGGEMRVGEDRLNFVHRDETILPKGFADGLRDLVGEGGRSPLSLGLTALGQFNGAPAGNSAGPGAWRMPDLSPARTSAPVASPPTSAPASARGGGGGGGRAVELHGTSAGGFFIANRKHLERTLRDLGRDFIKP